MKSFLSLLAGGCCVLGLGGCSTLAFNNHMTSVYPAAETTPVATGGDAADDPAIWVNTQQPQNSLILGTNKKSGLAIYDLSGQQVQFVEVGRVNNVDVRQGVLIDGKSRDIAAASNRTTNSLDLFSISDLGKVESLLSVPVDLGDPYGLCMFKQGSQAYAFINGKDGRYQQWLLNPQGKLKPQLTGEFQLQSQPEGCAADDSTGTLYLGEENLGIWVMPADASRSSEKRLIDRVGNGQLTADVEGMDIYQTSEAKILVVSSQGNNSYALYELNNDEAYLGSFRVSDHPNVAIDGSEETDGLAVSSVNFGGAFGEGLLVVQDGYNKRPKENQNFKLVPWTEIKQRVLEAP